MSMNTKKKTTIGAVAAVGAAAVALGAGTFAFFSSTGTPTETNATAGTLVLGQSVSIPADLEGFVPGGPSQTRTLTFTNEGSVTGDLSLVTTFVDTEDGCYGDELAADANCANVGGPGQLSEKLKVKVTRTGVATALYDNLVTGLPNANLDTSGVEEDESVIYTFEYYLPNGSVEDNAVQGDSVKVTTTATLKQP